MAEYINREAVLAEMTSKPLPNDASHLYLAMRGIVSKAPTADVAEVKHGKWKAGHYEGGILDGTDFEECSVCQFQRLFEDVTFKTTYSYCPNFGARMDIEKE